MDWPSRDKASKVRVRGRKSSGQGDSGCNHSLSRCHSAMWQLSTPHGAAGNPRPPLCTESSPNTSPLSSPKPSTTRRATHCRVLWCANSATSSTADSSAAASAVCIVRRVAKTISSPFRANVAGFAPRAGRAAWPTPLLGWSIASSPTSRYANGCCRCRTACATPARSTITLRKECARSSSAPLPASSFYRRAVSTKDMKANAGAIVFTQRFDSALRLNVHFHALWPDGVFTCALNKPQAEFHPARQITDADVSDLVRKIGSPKAGVTVRGWPLGAGAGEKASRARAAFSPSP